MGGIGATIKDLWATSINAYRRAYTQSKATTMELNLHKPIAPTTVQKPAVNAAVQYVIVNFRPDEWATIRMLLLDEDNNAIAAHDVIMTEEESAAWMGDDAYVLALATTKLNISDVVQAAARPRTTK